MDVEDPTWTGADLLEARKTLGHMWYGRTLRAAEMARALGVGGRDPGATIRTMEKRLAGKSPLTGPVRNLLRLYLAGALPPEGLDAIRKYGG